MIKARPSMQTTTKEIQATLTIPLHAGAGESSNMAIVDIKGKNSLFFWLKRRQN
jgi:hypothetical protein